MWLYQHFCGGISSHSTLHWHSFMHSSRLQFGPFQNLDSFSGILLEISSCLWDHCPAASFSRALAVRQMASLLTLEYFGIRRSSWLTQWLESAQVLLLQNKPTSSPMLDGGIMVLLLMCLVFAKRGTVYYGRTSPFLFSSDQRTLLRIYKYLHGKVLNLHKKWLNTQNHCEILTSEQHPILLLQPC